MHKRLSISLFSTILFSIAATAQQPTEIDSSSITIVKDVRLEKLKDKQAEINERTTRNARKTGKGFRLIIISSTNRNEAIAAKTQVYTNFPELKAYLWHQSPYYKVKAGNFKTREEATAYQSKLSIFFPKGVFIMNDVIELKPNEALSEE